MQGTQRLARPKHSIGKLPKFSLRLLLGQSFVLISK